MNLQNFKYIVVRLPWHNTNSIASQQNRIVIPKIGNIYYWGIDRMPWEDFDDAFYKDLLTDEMADLWNKKTRYGDDLTGIEVFEDLNVACKVLEYCNKFEERNEIIGVCFECDNKLISTNGENSFQSQWLGYDVYSMGEFSLILSGIYKYPKMFSISDVGLNDNGLFSDVDSAQEYIEIYNAKTRENICESVKGKIEIINIFREKQKK